MNESHWIKIDTYAKKWIKEAGEIIKSSFSEKLLIETKSNPSDFVTNMDKEIENYFISNIKKYFPDHKVFGEEGLSNDEKTLDGVVWIIDPIDGTMNFIHQQRHFAISVGIYENGIGKVGLIYDVMNDELYHARAGYGAFINEKKLDKLKKISVCDAVLAINATWVTPNKRIDHNILQNLIKDVRGSRSYGSAAIEIAYVVAGRLDAYITTRLSPWDFAAGIVLIEELGGVITTLKGETLNMLGENSVLVAKPGLHSSILNDYINKK